MPEVESGDRLTPAASHVYDGRQVDDYVSKLLEHIDLLDREIDSLKGRLSSPGPGGEDDDRASSERVLGRALLVAQQVAERLADEARQEGVALVAEAGRQRDEIVARAGEEAAAIAADGQREADRLVEDAKLRIASIPAEARSEALEITAAAEAEAERIVADARHQVEAATRAWDSYFEDKIAGIECRLAERISHGRRQPQRHSVSIDDALADARPGRDSSAFVHLPDTGHAPGAVPWPASMGMPGIDRVKLPAGGRAAEPPPRPTWLGVDVARMPAPSPPPPATPPGPTLDQVPPPPTGRPVIPVERDRRAGTSSSPLGRLFRR